MCKAESEMGLWDRKKPLVDRWMESKQGLQFREGHCGNVGFLAGRAGPGLERDGNWEGSWMRYADALSLEL